MQTVVRRRGIDGPLRCDVALLEFVLQLLQLGLQLWVCVGHGVECRAGVRRSSGANVRDGSSRHVKTERGAQKRCGTRGSVVTVACVREGRPNSRRASSRFQRAHIGSQVKSGTESMTLDTRRRLANVCLSPLVSPVVTRPMWVPRCLGSAGSTMRPNACCDRASSQDRTM
jgi:hypothetical protein